MLPCLLYFVLVDVSSEGTTVRHRSTNSVNIGRDRSISRVFVIIVIIALPIRTIQIQRRRRMYAAERRVTIHAGTILVDFDCARRDGGLDSTPLRPNWNDLIGVAIIVEGCIVFGVVFVVVILEI